jgi:hypothetical protein
MVVHITPEALDALRTVLAVATDLVDAECTRFDRTHEFGHFHRSRLVVIEFIEHAERTP